MRCIYCAMQKASLLAHRRARHIPGRLTRRVITRICDRTPWSLSKHWQMTNLLVLPRPRFRRYCLQREDGTSEWKEKSAWFRARRGLGWNAVKLRTPDGQLITNKTSLTWLCWFINGWRQLEPNDPNMTKHGNTLKKEEGWMDFKLDAWGEYYTYIRLSHHNT